MPFHRRHYPKLVETPSTAMITAEEVVDDLLAPLPFAMQLKLQALRPELEDIATAILNRQQVLGIALPAVLVPGAKNQAVLALACALTTEAN
jgi:hypothetical protein